MPIISPKETPQASTPQQAISRLAQTGPAPTLAAPVAEAAEEIPAQDELVAAAPVVKEELLSPRFAALAKQQKEIRRQQAEIARKEEEMKARLAKYEQDYIPRQKLSEDPLGILAQAGISYDKLVEMAVQYPTLNDPAIKQIREELNLIKEEKTQRQKLEEESQAKAYQTALNQVRNETKMLVDSDPSFETIKELGETETVVALIEETFKDEGLLLSVEEAAQKVEEYLVEDSLRKANLKKVKARLAPPPVPAQPEVLAPKKMAQTPIKTITHAAMSTPSKPLTSSERRARAIAVFRGEQI